MSHPSPSTVIDGYTITWDPHNSYIDCGSLVFAFLVEDAQYLWRGTGVYAPPSGHDAGGCDWDVDYCPGDGDPVLAPGDEPECDLALAATEWLTTQAIDLFGRLTVEDGE